MYFGCDSELLIYKDF